MTEAQAEQEAERRNPGYDAQATRVGERFRVVLTPRSAPRLPGVSAAELDARDESLVSEGDSFEEALESLSL